MCVEAPQVPGRSVGDSVSARGNWSQPAGVQVLGEHGQESTCLGLLAQGVSQGMPGMYLAEPQPGVPPLPRPKEGVPGTHVTNLP